MEQRKKCGKKKRKKKRKEKRTKREKSPGSGFPLSRE
jgi:hypothetical protein